MAEPDNPHGPLAIGVWNADETLQIESEVPREFIIILQGILILSVVITYQIAKRRLAARQLQRAGAAGELEDSAGSDEDAGPRGPEITGREAFERAGEGGV